MCGSNSPLLQEIRHVTNQIAAEISTLPYTAISLTCNTSNIQHCVFFNLNFKDLPVFIGRFQKSSFQRMMIPIFPNIANVYCKKNLRKSFMPIQNAPSAWEPIRCNITLTCLVYFTCRSACPSWPLIVSTILIN